MDPSIWIDIINPSDVHFFNSIMMELDYRYYVTLRNKSETVDLSNMYNISSCIVGRDYNNKYMKLFGVLDRILKLYLNKNIHNVDYVFSFENSIPCIVLHHSDIPVIQFVDNDLKYYHYRSSIQKYELILRDNAAHMVMPKCCEPVINNFYKNNIITYNGYKENIYLSHYNPKNIDDSLPFDNYIVIRPEASHSLYIKNKKSIVYDLIYSLKSEGYNILLLPREKEDIRIYSKIKDIYIPPSTLNGLDLCYYSDAVLTGSGTFAREAACMGIPSVSFFPSNSLLSVDMNLINEQKMIHSRSIHDIVDYLSKSKKNINLSYSINVRNELISKLNKLISD